MTFTMSAAMLTVVVLLLQGALGNINTLEDRGLIFKSGNESRCFGRIGCITTTQDWYSHTRPLNLSPDERKDIGTYFTLYTRDTIDGEKITVDGKDDVTAPHYDGNKPTKFITHGFMGNAQADWVLEIAQSLLARMDINVITVDWSKGAFKLYNQAVANTRVVGLEVGYVVNALIKKYGGSPENFHLIGHSLGAQISGYAGEKIKGLGRITGLDPAGPLFTDMPHFVRLDPSDAKFVDVIHTDAETIGYGIKEAIGDIDFFPNGGYRQPGCTVPKKVVNEGVMEAVQELPSCSHSRSEQLFLESITSSPYLNEATEKCPFVAFLCDSYEDFLDGKCVDCGLNGDKCALMGIDADKYPGKDSNSTSPKKFFLKTNENHPFCGYHYSVNLSLPTASNGRDSVAGNLKMTAFGETGVAKEMDLTQNGARTMDKGESYTFLGFSRVNTGKIKSVELEWEWDAKLFSKEYCLKCNKDLYVSGLRVTDMGYYPETKFKESALCQQHGGSSIKSGSSSVYSLNC